MKINYLTTNTLKFKLASNYFDGLAGYELAQHTFDAPEIQDVSCAEVARYSAVYAAKEIDEPCIKMDVGLCITALGGFPGPFVKYINDWLSEGKLLAMLVGEDNRTAYFMDATVIGFPDGSFKTFERKVPGRIANPGEYEPSKWPANSLFIPDGYDIPLGKMTNEEQETFWGDGAWPEVVKYLKNQ